MVIVDKMVDNVLEDTLLEEEEEDAFVLDVLVPFNVPGTANNTAVALEVELVVVFAGLCTASPKAAWNVGSTNPNFLFPVVC